MKKIKWFAALAFSIALSILPVSAVTLPQQDSSYYVTDTAGVITQEVKNRIVEINNDLEAKNGGQIVVVAVDFLNGDDIADVAYEVFNTWGIGTVGTNNGILLLLSVGDDDYYCLQGDGAAKTISSGQLQTVLDTYLEPDFAAGRYSDGVLKTVEALAGLLGQIAPNTKSAFVTDNAGMLSASVTDKVTSLNTKIKDKNGGALHVVVLNSLNGKYIDDVADQTFDQLMSGTQADYGVLLLLSIGDDDYYLLYGGGYDSVSKSFQNVLDSYLEPDFAAGKYSEGVSKTVDKLADQMLKVSGGSGVPGNNNNNNSSGTFTSTIMNVIGGGIALIVFVILLVVVASLLMAPRRRYRSMASPYVRPRRTWWWSPRPRYIRPADPWRSDHRNDGRPGGSWGSGGSSSRSSGSSWGSSSGSSSSSSSSRSSAGRSFGGGSSSRSSGGSAGRSSGSSGGMSRGGGGSSRGGGAGRRK